MQLGGIIFSKQFLCTNKLLIYFLLEKRCINVLENAVENSRDMKKYIYKNPFLSTPSFTTNLELARFEIDTENSGEHALLPRISTIQS